VEQPGDETWVEADRARPARPGSTALSRERGTKLFAALAAGDPDALEELYEAVADRVYSVALWRTGSVDDASDVVQEVFVKVAESRDRLEEVKEPLPWLLGLAHNVAVDAARRSRRRAAVPLDSVPFLAAAETDHASPVDAERASRLLGQLPAAQRNAIYLRHFEECSFAAIGRITGVPTFTAASRYRLGLGKLRRLMEGRR